MFVRSARGFPSRLLRSSHPDSKISLLEIVRGANHLLIKRLIKAPIDPVDISKDILARFNFVDHHRGFDGCGCGNNIVICNGAGGSSHDHEEISPGKSFVCFRVFSLSMATSFLQNAGHASSKVAAVLVRVAEIVNDEY